MNTNNETGKLFRSYWQAIKAKPIQQETPALCVYKSIFDMRITLLPQAACLYLAMDFYPIEVVALRDSAAQVSGSFTSILVPMSNLGAIPVCLFWLRKGMLPDRIDSLSEIRRAYTLYLSIGILLRFSLYKQFVFIVNSIEKTPSSKHMSAHNEMWTLICSGNGGNEFSRKRLSTYGSTRQFEMTGTWNRYQIPSNSTRHDADNNDIAQLFSQAPFTNVLPVELPTILYGCNALLNIKLSFTW